jgi:argininosuccinate lyase
MTNTGRWLQDFLQLCTREFQAIRVAEPYVQISSIMPQKRNPVSIEHSRSLASSAIGDAQSVITMVHNTPFGDIVDTEDDLQPHLYLALEKACRVMRLMTVVVRTLEVNKEHLFQKAREAYITITELSDALVREKGLSLRQAHKLASRIAREGIHLGLEQFELLPEMFQRIAKEELDLDLTLTEEEVKLFSDPKYFIEVRKITGGPNFQETRRMLNVRRSKLESDWNEHVVEVRFLETKDQKLKREIEELIKK